MGSNHITIEDLKSILDEKLAPLRSDVVELRQKIEETNKFLEFTNSQYEEMQRTFANHNKEQEQIKSENKILKSTIQTFEGTMKRLTESINDMEQNSRRECLEIKGIPSPKQNDGQEDTNKVVVKIGELMGIKVQNDDISVSHRLPVRKTYQGKVTEPAIIVKFISRDIKELLYRARKHLKGKTTRNLGYDKERFIYINESLTETNRKLFRGCMKAKKDMDYAFIWTSNGRMYVRKDHRHRALFIYLEMAFSNKRRSQKHGGAIYLFS